MPLDLVAALAAVAEGRAVLRARLAAIVARAPRLRGRVADAAEVLDAAGIDADAPANDAPVSTPKARAS